MNSWTAEATRKGCPNITISAMPYFCDIPCYQIDGSAVLLSALGLQPTYHSCCTHGDVNAFLQHIPWGTWLPYSRPLCVWQSTGSCSITMEEIAPLNQHAALFPVDFGSVQAKATGVMLWCLLSVDQPCGPMMRVAVVCAGCARLLTTGRNRQACSPQKPSCQLT